MGSTGSGNFSDYSGAPGGSRTPSDAGDGSDGGGDEGGSDPCVRAFHAELEEVAVSDYYSAHTAVPPLHTMLVITPTTRLEVRVSHATGEIVGYLPTRLHYLFDCLDNGHSYEGVITLSTTLPYPRIKADFIPS